MWSGAKMSLPASIAGSAPLPAACKSIPRSSGSNCNRSPKAPAAPPRNYGRRRRSEQGGLAEGVIRPMLSVRRRIFRVARQIVGDFEPRCLASDEDMTFRRDLWVVEERQGDAVLRGG